MHTVDTYGIHTDGGVTWLVQGRGGSNFVGLKAQCPFRVSGGMCNHLVPTAAPIPDRVHWEIFLNIFEDPLVQAMLPIPKPPGSNLFYIEDPFGDLGLYLTTLSRLSSPIQGVIKPAWTLKAKDLEKELKASNIQPLVIVQANQKVQPLIDALAQLAPFSSRTVIVTGGEEVVARPPFQRIKTQIRKTELEELMTLPMENIGAAVIRRSARREKLDAPMESRDERRNRQIRERSKD